MLNELITVLSRKNELAENKLKKLWNSIKALSRSEFLLPQKDLRVFDLLEAHLNNEEPRIRKLSMLILCKLIKSNGYLYIDHHNLAPTDGKITITQPGFIKENL